jgi:hypothetical protein
MDHLLLRVAGGLLAIIFLVGIALIAGHRYVVDNYEHAVVHLYNVNDVATVSVNCRVAQAVSRKHGATVDLGYLDDTDAIYISTFNRGHGAAWGFNLEIDGKRVAGGSRGAAASAGFEAPEQSVVMAKGFEANGKPLGTVGCAGPLMVSPRIRQYSRVPEASPVGKHPLPRWDPPTFPYALIDKIGGWAPLVLAALGFLVGVALREVRSFVRERWEWNFFLGLAAFLLALGAYRRGLVLGMVEAAGIALVLLSAILCLRKSCGAPAEVVQMVQTKPRRLG